MCTRLWLTVPQELGPPLKRVQHILTTSASIFLTPGKMSGWSGLLHAKSPYTFKQRRETLTAAEENSTSTFLLLRVPIIKMLFNIFFFHPLFLLEMKHTLTNSLVSDSSPQYTAPETHPFSQGTSSADVQDEPSYQSLLAETLIIHNDDDLLRVWCSLIFSSTWLWERPLEGSCCV